MRRRELSHHGGGLSGDPAVLETADLRALSENMGLVLDPGERFRDFLELMNEAGELLKMGAGRWKLA